MYERLEGQIEAFYPAPLEIHVQIDVRPARDGIVIFIRDVSERKEIERQLDDVELREKERLQELFEGAPAFLAVIRGPEHVFEMANTAYREMLGGRDLIGYRVIDCVPEVRETGWIEILDEVYRTGVPYAARGSRLMLAPKPGEALEERFVDYVYQPRRGADGKVIGIIALGIDVTDQRRAEKALIQNEKLAVVGRLASSIAHEINNPLGAAMNYLYLAGVCQDLQEVRECVSSAEKELLRVSVISTQTLLSQKQSAVPSTTTFQELTENILHLYHGRIKVAHVEVSSRHRTPSPLLCTEGEIRQALGNLIGNAIDAMYPAGGRLLLRSRAATDWRTGRQGNRLTIADTGGGIAGPILKHIFDPFFTTKGSLGNGLGLWITQDIVQRHQGEIRVRSMAGTERSGTVFTLFLPAVAIGV
jgi:signal transduction histidine kinase